MASLRELVTGVAHEINTPIGNSITVMTAIAELSLELSNDVDSSALSKEKFYRYVASIQKASSMLEYNLKTVVSLVTNFKQVATDQNSEQKTVFDLKNN